MALRMSFSPESSVRVSLVGNFAEVINLFAQLFSHGLAFARQVKISLYVIHAAAEIRIHGQRFFQATSLPHQYLRLLLIRPYIGIADLFFNFS